MAEKHTSIGRLFDTGVDHVGNMTDCPVCSGHLHWDIAPYGERMEALDHGMRQVLVTDHELGAFEDFYCNEQVIREEVGSRALVALFGSRAQLALYRGSTV